MTVTSIRDAWAEAQKIFPTDYEHDAIRSERAGYPIYYSTANGVNAWVSDLGNRLEVNLQDGKSVKIWIQAPAEGATSDSTEDTEDVWSATRKERRETAKRIQRFIYYYTKEYVRELDNKKREDAAVKEMEAAKEDGEIKCMVLTAENNARVMMGCITDCIAAVNILTNMEESVDDWMIAGINAMLDKVHESHTIPFDLPTSICGLLGAQYR